jgi:hypothetical protein
MKADSKKRKGQDGREKAQESQNGISVFEPFAIFGGYSVGSVPPVRFRAGRARSHSVAPIWRKPSHLCSISRLETAFSRVIPGTPTFSRFTRRRTWREKAGKFKKSAFCPLFRWKALLSNPLQPKLGCPGVVLGRAKSC